MAANTESGLAIVILSSTESHEGLGRVVNGLMTAREAQDGGANVEVLFDGAGAAAAAELANPDHKSHKVYRDVQDSVTGVCAFCARAFGVEESAKQLGIPFIDEYKQHPSLYGRIAKGAQVITF